MGSGHYDMAKADGGSSGASRRVEAVVKPIGEACQAFNEPLRAVAALRLAC